MPVDTGIAFGKYKKVLLSETEVLQEIPRISKQISELEKLQVGGNLQAYEILTIFILIYLHSRSERYLSSVPPGNSPHSCTPRILETSIKIRNLPEIFQPLFLKYNTHDTIYEFLIQNRFLKLPGEIQDFLINLAIYQYDIVLTSHEIDPFEMLVLQSSGKRAVTLSFPNAISGVLIDGRDAFEFLLHDLSHAHTFFHESYDTKGQIHFFKRILRHYKHFEPYKKLVGFEKKFIYLISDMNSHPEHLKAYLNASLREARKGHLPAGGSG